MPEQEEPQNTGPPPLRSEHTESLARLLEHAGISVLVSTYQAGRLIVLRSTGGVVNTHFRTFDEPMGLAVKEGRLAVSTRFMVWELGNYPQVGLHMPTGFEGVSHDACFVLSRGHVTGDLRTHEMGWGNEGLWLVNTRFSCLCTLAEDCSFVPRWKPRFVTALSNEDRCHLNGVAMLGGRPRLVTLLGKTDSPELWRAGKADGGCVMDIETDRAIADGLCMPHSPRFHEGKVWFLESGRGRLSCIDAEGSRPRVVAELPGFTRGLEFWGRFAFVGLSRVREKYFSGLPITDRLKPQERKCGVWVVDTATGTVAGFVEFLSGVEEIFDVRVLHGIQFPEIVDLSMEQVQTAYVLPEGVMGQTAPARVSPFAAQDAAETSHPLF